MVVGGKEMKMGFSSSFALSLSVYVSACLCLSLCLCLYLCLSISLSLSVSLLTPCPRPHSLSVCLSLSAVCLPVCLPLSLFLCLCPSVCLSVCLPLSLSQCTQVSRDEPFCYLSFFFAGVSVPPLLARCCRCGEVNYDCWLSRAVIVGMLAAGLQRFVCDIYFLCFTEFVGSANYLIALWLHGKCLCDLIE